MDYSSNTTVSGAAWRALRHKPRRSSDPRTARRSADRWATSHVPNSIAWTLSNPQLARPRLTPFQWSVLAASWVEWDGYVNGFVLAPQPRGRAARRLHEPGDRVKQARDEAERRAYELFYQWAPAFEHWTARKKAATGKGRLSKREARLALKGLSDRERLILKRYARPKSGRREAPDVDFSRDPYRDALDGEPGSLNYKDDVDPEAGARTIDAAGGLWDD